MVKESVQVRDLDHGSYVKHQEKEISPIRVVECAHQATPAHHFKFEHGKWIPIPYEGFAVVSMVDHNPLNSTLSFQLEEIQDELMDELDATSYFLLPAASFHQTIANTLSENRFERFIQELELEHDYPNWISRAFKNINLPEAGHPIKMKLIGLSVFHTAIGILGVINSEKDYNRITSFRSQFYSDQQLAALDVKMTRPFIGHITLAYIEKELSIKDKDKLAKAVKKINKRLSVNPCYFLISNAELRRYHHLAEFRKTNDYPTFNF